MSTTRAGGTRPERRPATAFKPSADQLEGRQLLYATLGGNWLTAYGSRITYSFAPDGAMVGGTASTLNQTMAARGFTTQQWQDQFRRAAGTWQTVAGINLVEVSDNGAALGVSGNQQSDSRFGDIRFFGVPTSEGTLAYAMLPPPFNGGTAAGDVVFGTTQAWNINSTYDIQTVAIHEIGHALGLDHSTITSAVMYSGYNGVKQYLTSDDVSGIRSIYGPRQQDGFDASSSNYDPWHATNLSGYVTSTGKVSLGGLDITTADDADWYYVQAPANASGSLRISMQSTGLSSLSPRIQVYNSALQLAGWTTAPNASTTFGGAATLNFSGVGPGTGIFIKAMSWNGASSGPNGTGHYGFHLDFTGGPPAPLIQAVPTVVAEQPDQGGGSIPEVFQIETDRSKWVHNTVKVVGQEEFLAHFNGAALGWLDPVRNMAPASADVVLPFPDVELPALYGLLQGAKGDRQALVHLAMFDSILDQIGGSGSWENASHVERKVLKFWARQYASKLAESLA